MVVSIADLVAARENRVKFRDVSNPEGKFDLNEQIVFGSHRSGWAAAINALTPLHNPAGVLMEGFLECRFAWDIWESARRGEAPIRNPWVGFLHNPPNAPHFAEHRASPQMIMESWHMQASLPYCQGMFVFSEYLANWLSERIDAPVNVLTHPTDLSVTQFSPEQFQQHDRPKIVQVGSWLRRLNSIRLLPTFDYDKFWIAQSDTAREHERIQWRNSNTFGESGLLTVGQYEEIEWLPNDEYDKLLSESVVFLDLYDSSANNSIVECIARSTPVLVNPLPAVVEYLGADYPLYFESLEEAAYKVNDQAYVMEAHHYLKNMDKTRFSYDQFLSDVRNSEIYKKLPSPDACKEESRNATVPLDKASDLNIVSGQPIDAEYVFVVAFRNQADKIQRCLESIQRHHQDYDYGIIVIDDASEDGSCEAALSSLSSIGKPFVLVENKDRKYYTRNLHNAVHHLCLNDESVVIEVDGDDHLEDRDVLSILSDTYAEGYLRTYGRFRCGEGAELYPAREFLESENLKDFIDVGSPWDLDLCFSWMHLKTFKKKLFLEVPLVFFLEKDGSKWLRMAEDLSIHPKMTEIAGTKTKFIDEVLYVYDLSGGAHDIVHPDQEAYIIEKLYKAPTGTFIGTIMREMQEADVERKFIEYCDEMESSSLQKKSA